MSVQRSITDVGFKVLNEAHRATLRLSGWRIGRSVYGMPVVELRNVGRKTGQAGANELTIHGQGSYAFPQIHPAAEIRRVGRLVLAAQEVG